MVMSEIRVSLRRLLRSPGYAVAAVVSLGAGIAVAVAALSLVNALVFNDVAGLRDRRTLVRLQWTGGNNAFTTPELDALETRTWRAFGPLAAQGDRDLPALLPSGPATLSVALVSSRFFETLGTTAIAGRLLMPADADAASPPVVVIGERLWRRAFDASPSIIGQPITIAGRIFTIVGVTPVDAPGLRLIDLGMSDADAAYPQAWLSLRGAQIRTSDASPWLSIAGRLTSDATLAQAQADAGVAANSLRAAFRGRDRESLRAFRADLDWQSDPGYALITIGIYLVLPLCVLIIGCVNVTSLQWTRAIEQFGALSVRVALGASRAALVRVMAVDVVVLSVLSGFVGWLGARLLLSRVAVYFPRDLLVGGWVFVFIAGLMVFVVATAGMLPAWLASRAVIAAGLRTMQSGGPLRSRLRHTLLVVQVAASVALLAISGLATRALTGRQSIPPANAASMLLTDVRLADVRSTDPRSDLFVAAVLDRLRQTSSTQHAAVATFGVAGHSMRYATTTDAQNVSHDATGGYVTPEWFDATDTRFLAGRRFSETGAVGPDVVVNVALASALSSDPVTAIGTEIRRPNGQLARIVGVVADTERSGDGQPVPMLYAPLPAKPPLTLTVVARARNRAMAEQAMRDAIAAADPLVPIGRIESFDERTQESFRGYREVTWYALALGGLVLALAAAGLHAMLSYNVRRRAKEIGIRMAIGASSIEVARLIAQPALVIAAIGSGIGLAIAMAAALVMRALLLGLSPLNLRASGPSVVALVLVTILVSSAAVVRALRIDPAEALREE
jgi:putative ABC transport system permease protein